MSGVFGLVSPERASEVGELLGRMSAALAHGQEMTCDTFVQLQEGVGLGRVGIGIFNREPQPVWSDDRTVALFMAGELFQFEGRPPKGHRWRPEDYALSLYEQHGDEFLKWMNGAFQVAIWDARRHRLILGNDRFGLYPMYYALRDGTFSFGPEMNAVLSDPRFVRKLDMAAVAEYVRFQHLLGDRTFFEDVRLLPSASLLGYDLRETRLTLTRYWGIGRIPRLPAGLRFEEAAEEAERRLRQAVRRRLDGRERIGVFLSGGLDSRVLLGMASETGRRVPTVTYGIPDCRDMVYAAAVARRAGSDHHALPFVDGRWVLAYHGLHTALTEGFHTWVHAHGISVLEAARQWMEVDLSGFGGGHTALDWGDPSIFAVCDDDALASRLFAMLVEKTTWPSLTEAEEDSVYQPEIRRTLRGYALASLREALVPYVHLPHSQRVVSFALENPDRRLFLYYTVFRRWRIEQRFPFYDYEYFDFVYALPPEMLRDRRLRKAIIWNSMRHLAIIPYDKDELPATNHSPIRLGARMVKRAKAYINRRAARVFPEYFPLHSDYESWLRGDLHAWAEDLLFSERALSRGLFRPDGVRSLWRRLQAGREHNLVGKLGPLMSLELVMRRFVDTSSAESARSVVLG